MRVVKQLLDKIFFTLGVIVFLQLPYFIDQYMQRIGGYTESQIQQLSDYKSIADNNYNGNLSLLIKAFKNSKDEAVRQTGEKINTTQIDVIALNREISFLETQGLFKKVVFLLTNIRLNIASGTLGAFRPGIPLSIWSLVYGLIGGVLFSIIFNATAKIPQIVLRKLKKPHSLKSMKSTY